MNQLIKDSISKGITYQAYSELIQRLVAEEKTTGDEQSLERVEFTRLNASRQKRLDKTIHLSEEDIKSFTETPLNQTWLVLTESWCGDAAQTIPILNKISEAVPGINLKIVLRDENTALMNAFLTSGTQSIPKLIIVDRDNTVIASWGSRSKAATQLVIDYKKEHGKIDETFKKDLQIWYNKDKGVAIINDLLEIVAAFKTMKKRSKCFF